MRRSLYTVAVARTTIAPAAARTTGATGTSVDRGGLDSGGFRSAMLIIHTGTVTDGTHRVELQESDDGSSWSPVADAHLQGAEPSLAAGDNDRVHEVGYTGHARYLRAVVTVSDTPVTGGVYGAVILLGWPGTMPPNRS